MTLLALSLATLLSQTEALPADRAATAAERAAAAAERAALAAEKAAAAAERIAQLQTAVVVVEAAEATVAIAPEKWIGSLGVGLIVLTGNAESLTGTFAFQADRKFNKWAVGFRAGAAYGQTRAPTGEDQITALRGMLTARLDRSVASFATLYALVGIETDHIKSVELRGYGEVGTGIVFYEKKEAELERLYLRGDVAFRVQHDSRYQYYADATFPARTGLEGVTLVAPRFGVVFRYAMSKLIRFSEEAEVMPNILGAPRYLVNSTTKLNAHLTTALSIAVTFLVNFDSAPAGGKKDTDTALTLGLDAAF